MTIDILNTITKAYAAGLADGARKAEVVTRLYAEHLAAAAPSLSATRGNGIDVSHRGNIIAADLVATSIPQPLKAQKVTRGGKKQAVARETGVKDGIIAAINAGSVTISDILLATGYKETSIRGTLMQMRTRGLVSVEGRGKDGVWSLLRSSSEPSFNGDVVIGPDHA